MKRLFALFLTFLLTFSVIPFGAFAAENGESPVLENAPKPNFITQPQDVTTTVDTIVTISFEAENYDRIDWYIIEDGMTTNLCHDRHPFSDLTVKDNTLEIKVGHLGSGTQFFAEITYYGNGGSEKVKSDVATLYIDMFPKIRKQLEISRYNLEKRSIILSVHAYNYHSFRWEVEDNGEIMPIKEARDKYGFLFSYSLSGCSYPDRQTDLFLEKITEEMRGLKFTMIYCGFDKKSETRSNTITLDFGELPPISDTSLESSSATSSVETVTDTKSEICDTDVFIEESHVHSFSGDYESNSESHYRVCSCGKKSEEEPHIIKNNICKKCGYILSDNTLKPYVVTIIITGGILIISALVYLLIAYKKRIFPFKKVNIDTID